jgi:hypothetical protein
VRRQWVVTSLKISRSDFRKVTDWLSWKSGETFCVFSTVEIPKNMRIPFLASVAFCNAVWKSQVKKVPSCFSL